MLCELEKADEFKDSNNGTGADIIRGRLYEGCFEGRMACLARAAAMKLATAGESEEEQWKTG